MSSAPPFLPPSRPPSSGPVPEFEPVRIRRGLLGLLRGAGRVPRAVAVSLAVAAVLLAWGPRGGPGGEHAPPAVRSAAERAPAPAPASRGPVRPRAESSRSSPDGGAVTVRTPVRIADAAVVRLLRPGDRVDVLATAVPEAAPAPGDVPASGGVTADVPADRARIVARNARVAAVPAPDPGGATGEEAGALVVLSVPRPTAARLAGAAARSRLAVALC